MVDRILTRTERAAARLCTGPLAHLLAGLIDLVQVLVRIALSRGRDRVSARGEGAAVDPESR